VRAPRRATGQVQGEATLGYRRVRSRESFDHSTAHGHCVAVDSRITAAYVSEDSASGKAYCVRSDPPGSVVRDVAALMLEIAEEALLKLRDIRRDQRGFRINPVGDDSRTIASVCRKQHLLDEGWFEDSV
jgi:hypothetical protein